MNRATDTTFGNEGVVVAPSYVDALRGDSAHHHVTIHGEENKTLFVSSVCLIYDKQPKRLIQRVRFLLTEKARPPVDTVESALRE